MRTYQDMVVESLQRGMRDIAEYAPTVLVFVSYIDENGQGHQLCAGIGDQASHYGMAKEFVLKRERGMGDVVT